MLAADHLGQAREHHRCHDRERNDRHGHREQQRDERQLRRDGEPERRVKPHARRDHHHQQAQDRRKHRDRMRRVDPPQTADGRQESQAEQHLDHALARHQTAVGLAKRVGQQLLLLEVGLQRHLPVHRPNVRRRVSGEWTLCRSNIRPGFGALSSRAQRAQPKPPANSKLKRANPARAGDAKPEVSHWVR